MNGIDAIVGDALLMSGIISGIAFLLMQLVLKEISAPFLKRIILTAVIFIVCMFIFINFMIF